MKKKKQKTKQNSKTKKKLEFNTSFKKCNEQIEVKSFIFLL